MKKNSLTRISLLVLLYYAGVLWASDKCPQMCQEIRRQIKKCTIKAANVIYDMEEGKYHGKIFKIPIFMGHGSDITYAKLESERVKAKFIGPGEYALQRVCYEVPPGKGQATLMEFLNFYKSSLLKDIDIYQPTVIGPGDGGWMIWYDFEYEGVPGTMMIPIMADANAQDKVTKNGTREITDLREILPTIIDAPFSVNYGFGKHSQWYKEKK